MYKKCNETFTSNPKYWTDYTITRLVGWYNYLGFRWFSIVQLMIANLCWSSNYLVLLIVNVTVVGIILTRSIELQILDLVLMPMARFMLFSFHHAYILDIFDIEYFGTLNGISCLIAAIVGLLSYPLQLYALLRNFSVSFIPIGCGIIFSVAIPLILQRRMMLNWAESIAIKRRKLWWLKDINELVALFNDPEKNDAPVQCTIVRPLLLQKASLCILTDLTKSSK